MQVNYARQYLHREPGPFEPMLSDSLKRQGKVFLWLRVFIVVLLVVLAMRSLWELHDAGRPIAGTIAWAGFVSAGITIALWFRSRHSARPPSSDAPRPD